MEVRPQAELERGGDNIERQAALGRVELRGSSIVRISSTIDISEADGSMRPSYTHLQESREDQVIAR